MNRKTFILAPCILIGTFCFSQVVPNDPHFLQQWGIDKVKIPLSWAIETGGISKHGDPIVIAVLDDGFDLNHEDINYFVNIGEIPNNNIDDDGNGYVDDYIGWDALDEDGVLPVMNHGTATAGIIGAIGNNGFGISGVNWNIKILPIRVSTNTPSSVIEAYEYVLALRRLYNNSNGIEGAFIVATNLSQSRLPAYPSDYPGWCSIYDELGAEGILNVNSPKNIDSELTNEMPALCGSDYLIVVTGTKPSDAINDDARWSTSHVDIGAPGTNIHTTNSNSTYGSETGTSFAAPFVTGAIGLMYSALCESLLTEYKNNGAVVALHIKNLLMTNSDPVVGLMDKVKYGRLNVHRALSGLFEQMDDYLFETLNGSGYSEAITEILFADYSFPEANNLIFTSGGRIVLKENTIIMPSDNDSFVAKIDDISFQCSIPYEPVSVHLSVPSPANCAFLIYLNAAAYGGTPPYTYHWESRLITASDWHVHPQTSYLLVLNSFYPGSFFVRVKVTDSRGMNVWSATEMVVCFAGIVIGGNDDNSAEDYAVKSQSINDDLIIQTGFVYPNPTSQILYYSNIDCENVRKYMIYDATMRVINIKYIDYYYVNNRCMGVDISRLSSGIYWFCAIRDMETEVHKFIVE